MRLNLEEFDNYLQENVFKQHRVLHYEVGDNPSIHCCFNSASFRYDTDVITFKNGDVALTHIFGVDYVDVSSGQGIITSIRLHTKCSEFQKGEVVKFWHLSQIN